MYPLLNVTSTLRGFGGKGIRTPDLLIANETLYQLSYTPEIGEKLLRRSCLSASTHRGFGKIFLARVIFGI